MCVCVYLVDEVQQGLGQATVFLSQEAVPPLLLLQDLLLTLPQVLHVLTVLLITHTSTGTPHTEGENGV